MVYHLPKRMYWYTSSASPVKILALFPAWILTWEAFSHYPADGSFAALARHRNPLSEAHLTSTYIHPFLHGLLSAKKPAKVAHCSNMVPEKFDDAVDRPDYETDIFGYRFSYTSAFGEVKKSSNISLTLLVKDFYRLCIFSKEAIDRYNLRYALFFQVTANSVTFFTMQWEFPSIYQI
ncbi:hypothetical protein BCR42DRAFT_420540 [Absidia repens]|uniref:Uncharacterized protein n=1 Tax=Absidia repens TaxID=90262 RepID=A0A1X2I9V9_9FUNG|nr:hypothetical protein BCR42DRAFT_420540 [Absidia repens]